MLHQQLSLSSLLCTSSTRTTLLTACSIERMRCRCCCCCYCCCCKQILSLNHTHYDYDHELTHGLHSRCISKYISTYAHVCIGKRIHEVATVGRTRMCYFADWTVHCCTTVYAIVPARETELSCQHCNHKFILVHSSWRVTVGESPLVSHR
jgi:hypothetical protein